MSRATEGKEGKVGQQPGRQWGRALKRSAVSCTLAVLLLSAPPLVPAARAESGLAYEGFIGLSSAIASLVYSPLKIVYAVGGTAVSTVALLWTFGSTEVAGPILTQSVGGDYVVVPGHLRRERRLEFFGPH
jgi:hypothetical protein